LSVAWHYTTFVDFLDHWQAIIAGVLGFAAAIIVVRITLQIERRKADRELDALRKSLGVELRAVARNALATYNSLMNRVRNNTATTGQTLQIVGGLSTPIVFPACASKIGLLGSDAMEIVVIYSFIEIARGGVTSLERVAAELPLNVLVTVADPLLRACERTKIILKNFQTGNPAYDQLDNVFIELIDTALRDAASAAHPATGAKTP
jgi:hypothetical protein